MEGRFKMEDLNDVCDKLDDVCGKLNDVETAVKNNKSDWWASGWMWFGWMMVFFVWIPALCSSVIHSRVAYSLYYAVDTDNVSITDKPHDCAFLTSPVGDKWCHYDRNVDVNHHQDGTNSAVFVDWIKVEE
jgi:hypothetical protein